MKYKQVNIGDKPNKISVRLYLMMIYYILFQINILFRILKINEIANNMIKDILTYFVDWQLNIKQVNHFCFMMIII